MKESRNKLLKMIYEHAMESSHPFQISVDGNDIGSDYLTLKGDVIYLERNDYIIESINIPRCYCLELTEKGETYVENGFKHQSDIPQPTTNFNISGANFNNSIVGNNISNNEISVSTSASLSELESLIATKPAEDQELLKELLAALQRFENGSEPISKGIFARFSDLIKKHIDLITSITDTVIGALFWAN